MRTRSIPFGYEVVGGKYVVNNGEAEIISSRDCEKGKVDVILILNLRFR